MKFRAHRLPATSQLQISYDGVQIAATLRNISVTGALLRTADRVAPGATITLIALSKSWGATVVWAREGLIGVHFDRCLSAAQLRALRQPGHPTRQNFIVRPVHAGAHGFRELR